jgi:hypothetical protein
LSRKEEEKEEKKKQQQPQHRDWHLEWVEKEHRGKCIEEHRFCFISWLLSIQVEGSLSILNGKIRSAVALFFV